MFCKVYVFVVHVLETIVPNLCDERRSDFDVALSKIKKYVMLYNFEFINQALIKFLLVKLSFC